MGWLRVGIDLDEAEVAAAESLLESLDAVSMTLTGAGDEAVLEPDPGMAPLWRRCRLEALFELSADAGLLKTAVADAGLSVTDVDFVDDADWTERWRQHAVDLLIGQRLWLVPRDSVPPAEPALRLDPGLAFGSGGHPTTRLCLDWLASQDLAGRRVLDFGCGSGILGLAALKLGCESVLAIDHDPQALLATRDNAAYNALADERLTVALPDIEEGASFDLVLANILANPLIELAPTIGRALADGAVLVMSGMLEEQSGEVMAAYPELVFEPVRVAADEQGARWACLVGVAPENK
jgi:ribosomal protein L11 methyltransferase